MAVMVRCGCRLADAEGMGGILGDELDCDGERVERDEELLVCWVETEGRLCQAGGGFSGSPDNCLCKVLVVLTGDVGDRELFDRFGDFGDVDR